IVTAAEDSKIAGVRFFWLISIMTGRSANRIASRNDAGTQSIGGKKEAAAASDSDRLNGPLILVTTGAAIQLLDLLAGASHKLNHFCTRQLLIVSRLVQAS